MSAFSNLSQSDNTSSAHPAQEVALNVQPKVGSDNWALGGGGFPLNLGLVWARLMSASHRTKGSRPLTVFTTLRLLLQGQQLVCQENAVDDGLCHRMHNPVEICSSTWHARAWHKLSESLCKLKTIVTAKH